MMYKGKSLLTNFICYYRVATISVCLELNEVKTVRYTDGLKK